MENCISHLEVEVQKQDLLVCLGQAYRQIRGHRRGSGTTLGRKDGEHGTVTAAAIRPAVRLLGQMGNGLVELGVIDRSRQELIRARPHG
jgi:hypothetical protein